MNDENKKGGTRNYTTEEIEAAKKRLVEELNLSEEADIMVGGGQYKKFIPPTECGRCHTPLADCKGVVDSKMDGLHPWKEGFYCDACLLKLGAEELQANE